MNDDTKMRDLFDSSGMRIFRETYCVGNRAYRTFLDHASRIIVVGPDDNLFFAISSAKGEQVSLHQSTTALGLVDPNSNDSFQVFDETRPWFVVDAIVHLIGHHNARIHQEQMKRDMDDRASARESMRAFYSSDAVVTFIGKYCVGDHPWSVILDGNDRIVVSCPETTTFLVMAPVGNSRASVFETDDPLQVIEPEARGLSVVIDDMSIPLAFEMLVAKARTYGLPEPEPASPSP